MATEARSLWLLESLRTKSGAILHVVDYDWDDEKAASNLENMEFLLRKQPQSLVIPFMLIFTTRTIPLMSIGILLWGNRGLGVC